MFSPTGVLYKLVGGCLQTTLAVFVIALCGHIQIPMQAQTVGGSVPGLTAGEVQSFNAGVKFFGLVWIADDFGFGPVFTARGCSSCHKNPNMGGSGATQHIRFGKLNSDGSFDPMLSEGGPILQPGTIATLGVHSCTTLPGEVLPSDATIVSHRQTPPIYGDSFIDAIPDATILANQSFEASDPTDQSLGIHGVANMVPDMLGVIRPGRFGFKAFAVTLLQITSFAMTHDLSVTNLAYPVEDLPQGQPIPSGCDLATYHPNDPDFVSGRVASSRLTSYFPAYLAAPVPAPSTPTALLGQQTFVSIGCAQCHMPSLKTGPNFAVPLDYPAEIGGTGKSRVSAALSNQNANLYSDLLLHDMGLALADGVPEGQATGSQWRTTPLWGLSHKSFLLHDGRTGDIDTAIDAHGGESRVVIQNYNALSPTDKANLLEFLHSL